MQSFDAIIVGAGIIGTSLALELRQRDLEVLLLDRGQPGQEASTAGAGMLAACEVEGPPALRELARLGAAMYPAYVREAEQESGRSIDFNRSGAIRLSDVPGIDHVSPDELAKLEPALAGTSLFADFVEEDFVDPRTLMPALFGWAERRGVHIHGGSEVTALLTENRVLRGVRTARTSFNAPIVVNCAGAWAGALADVPIPARPVKGHMLTLLPSRPHPIQHVLRHCESDVYLVPRRDGHIAVGSTLEEAGFDKRVDTDTIQRLHQEAANILPELGEARIHEVWTGLRPGTPDKLPILGATGISGYFVATGHFRNGILLAPSTARMVASIITGVKSDIDPSPFAAARFGSAH